MTITRPAKGEITLLQYYLKHIRSTKIGGPIKLLYVKYSTNELSEKVKSVYAHLKEVNKNKNVNNSQKAQKHLLTSR